MGLVFVSHLVTSDEGTLQPRLASLLLPNSCFTFALRHCDPLLHFPEIRRCAMVGVVCWGRPVSLGFALPSTSFTQLLPSVRTPLSSSSSLIFIVVWSSWVVIWLVVELLLFLTVLASWLHVVFTSDRLSSKPQGLLHGFGFGAWRKPHPTSVSANNGCFRQRSFSR
jgi:hypothetical protein